MDAMGERQAARWLSGRIEEILESTRGEETAGDLLDTARQLARLNLDRASYLAEVRRTPGYFRNNHKRMQYDAFRAAGYPIGSGTVESGAKNVVQHRLRRPGRGERP